jgi:hypothetical protein
LDYSLDIAISLTCPSNVKQSTALENKIEHSPLYTGCLEGNACKFFQAKKPEPETAEAYKMPDQKLRCKSG